MIREKCLLSPLLEVTFTLMFLALERSCKKIQAAWPFFLAELLHFAWSQGLIWGFCSVAAQPQLRPRQWPAASHRCHTNLRGLAPVGQEGGGSRCPHNKLPTSMPSGVEGSLWQRPVSATW